MKGLLCLLALLLACLWSSCDQTAVAKETTQASPPVIAVRVSTGFKAIASPAGSAGPWIVPVTTRSERRICASVWMDEVEFLQLGSTTSNPLRIQAVSHLNDQELVRDEQGLCLIGEPKPWPASLQNDPLPWLRRDGQGASAKSLTLPPVGDGQAWVLFPVESDWRGTEPAAIKTKDGDLPRPATRDGVWIVEPKESSVHVLPEGTVLDALFLCDITRVTIQEIEEVAVQRVEGADRLLPQTWNWAPHLGVGPDLPHFSERKATEEELPWHKQAELWRVRMPRKSLSGGETSRQWTFILSLDRAERAVSKSDWIEASTRSQPTPLLKDATQDAGIAFMHVEGPDLQMDIRPTMGPGAAFGDFDGDGWQDLYLVQGGGRPGWPKATNRLYRNLGDGTFSDVTRIAGVGDTGAGMGSLFFDADSDGDLDLYVANYGKDVVYQNLGNGTFSDVTQAAGLNADLWSASVSAADYDGDGDLDVYVTSYLDFDTSKMPPADELHRFQREDPIEMLPFAFPGQRNLLLRNDTEDGKIVFVDVAKELGVDNSTGLSMQAIWWDFDHDLDPDLYIANDVSANVLYLNKGDGTFEDITFAAGLDDPRGGMGLDAGDVDQDGDEDIFLSNWQLESNALYLNNGARRSAARTRRANFQDRTVASGLGPAGVGVTSWGVCFLDQDLDGDLDLFVANGYTSPDYATTGICVGQPNHLFQNAGRGRFIDASAIAGPALAKQSASRSSVACDYDRDGDLDLLVTSNNGWAQLLRNDTPRKDNHSVTIRLHERGQSSFGIGARVQLQAGSKTWTQSMRAGMGYLSGNAPELVFGVGTAKGPVRANVYWRNGTETSVELPALDSAYELYSDGTMKQLR